MVPTFFFFDLYRGSRGLPLVFLDFFMYFLHFRISGVATYKPSLGPFFGSKEKKTFKPPYLKINFSTNMTFLQNTAEFTIMQIKRIISDCIKTVTRGLANISRKTINCPETVCLRNTRNNLMCQSYSVYTSAIVYR